MKTIVTIAASALAGALVVVACSDDSPTPADADAGACNCPSAEPPITTARLHRVDSGLVEVPLASIGEAGVACPASEILIGGSCYIEQDGTAQQVSLRQAGMAPREGTATGSGWLCTYGNTSSVATAMVRAQALCLRP